MTERKISNYTSNKFNDDLFKAVRTLEDYNYLIDAVDSEIESQLKSQCSVCDLRRI